MHVHVIVRWNLDSVLAYMGRASLLLRQYSIMAQCGAGARDELLGLSWEVRIGLRWTMAKGVKRLAT